MKDIYVWEFWLSDKPENKIQGYIEKKQYWDYELILKWSFKKTNYFVGKNCEKWRPKSTKGIINGIIINDGQRFVNNSISLLGISTYNEKLPEWMPQTYYFDQMIFWKHFKGIDEVFFDSIELWFEWLSSFVWETMASDIKMSSKTDSFLSPEKIEINIDKSKLTIPIWVSDDYNFSFLNKWSFSNKKISSRIRGKRYNMWGEISLNSYYVLKVISEQWKFYIRDIEDKFIVIQRLFSLIFWKYIKLNLRVII